MTESPVADPLSDKSADPDSPISLLASQLDAAAKAQPEFLRAELMRLALTSNFHFAHQPVAGCFAAAYGDDGATFWGVECAEPVEARQFVHLLTVTREPSEFSNPGRPDLEKQVMDKALGAALVAIHQSDPANRAVFAGDLSSLETARHGHQLHRELKVHIRPAVTAILALPKRRHLVPKSLVEFVEGATAAETETAAEWAVPNPHEEDAGSEEDATGTHATRQLKLPNPEFEEWFAKGETTTRDVGDFARKRYTRKSVEALVVARIGPRKVGRPSKVHQK